MAKIKIKRRIEQFYVELEDGSTVFALYEDVNHNIHYRYVSMDPEKYVMVDREFYRQFKLEEY
ncbi:hypothetical protein [Paenibacillus shenyangensis]|uniref:hypothetical protein n=1 Tax=Paenibacillus sp. A9 TaxID=1284352 RepID=UPI0003759D0B|nr:hypothetical protein [Paenibacillus sp. A9]